MGKTKRLLIEFSKFLKLVSIEERKRNSKMVLKIKNIIRGLKRWCLVDSKVLDGHGMVEGSLGPYICYGSSYPIPVEFENRYLYNY